MRLRRPQPAEARMATPRPRITTSGCQAAVAFAMVARAINRHAQQLVIDHKQRPQTAFGSSRNEKRRRF